MQGGAGANGCTLIAAHSNGMDVAAGTSPEGLGFTSGCAEESDGVPAVFSGLIPACAALAADRAASFSSTTSPVRSDSTTSGGRRRRDSGRQNSPVDQGHGARAKPAADATENTTNTRAAHTTT